VVLVYVEVGAELEVCYWYYLVVCFGEGFVVFVFDLFAFGGAVGFGLGFCLGLFGLLFELGVCE